MASAAAIIIVGMEYFCVYLYRRESKSKQKTSFCGRECYGNYWFFFQYYFCFVFVSHLEDIYVDYGWWKSIYFHFNAHPLQHARKRNNQNNRWRKVISIYTYTHMSCEFERAIIFRIRGIEKCHTYEDDDDDSICERMKTLWI